MNSDNILLSTEENSSQQDYLLKVKDLCVSVNKSSDQTESLPVLNSINFNLSAGEIIGIIGEAGSGKVRS